MERITQAQAIKATTKAVKALVALAQAINTTNLDIGRVFNRLASDPMVVIANTSDKDKRDDTTKGIDLALAAIALRAGLAKQRVSEWRDNARVHDLGIAADLDMSRAGVSVGKDLPNGMSDADIAKALVKAFDATNDKAKAKVDAAKGKANKANARAKAKVAPVTRKAVSTAAGITTKPSGTNGNRNGKVTKVIDHSLALAGALAQARAAVDGLAKGNDKGNVLVGNDRKVARDMIATMTKALDAKVVSLVA